MRERYDVERNFEQRRQQLRSCLYKSALKCAGICIIEKEHDQLPILGWHKTFQDRQLAMDGSLYRSTVKIDKSYAILKICSELVVVFSMGTATVLLFIYYLFIYSSTGPTVFL